MNSPHVCEELHRPIAAPVVAVGRMIEHLGSFRLRNIVGSGHDQVRLEFSPESRRIVVREN